jgi:hypothetical protein
VNKYIDGEDPDEERIAMTSNYTTHDIGIISNFSKLRRLEIDTAELMEDILFSLITSSCYRNWQ